MSQGPAKGEVWLADFSNPLGKAENEKNLVLVIFVSGDDGQGLKDLVVGIPLANPPLKLPIHVLLAKVETGLQGSLYACCDRVQSFSVQRFLERRGVVAQERLELCEKLVRVVAAKSL